MATDKNSVMNRVFLPRDFFTVPDGTDVSAFLNATDLTQDVPWGALGEMSIAAGCVRPRPTRGCTFIPLWRK
jgi:hypothetical protein